MTERLMAEWFWVDDFEASDASLLPMEAIGIYRTMLSRAWVRGAKLPKDPKMIQRLIRATDEEWSRSWPLVAPFWKEDGDSLICEWQVRTYAASLARRDFQREGGKRRAEQATRGVGGRFQPSTQPATSQQAGPASCQQGGPASIQPLDLDLSLDLEQDQSQKVKPSASPVSPPSPEPSGLFGPDGPDGETRPEPQKPKTEPNGAKILADLWAELCPHLDQPRRPLAPGIARSLVASWKRDPDADLWRERFAFVAESDTYSGRKPGFSWKADISWATGPKNSAKLDAKANRNHEAPVENFSDYNRRSAEQAKRIRLPWETEDVAPWDGEALPNGCENTRPPPVRMLSHEPDPESESAVAAKVNGMVRGFLNGHR